MAPTGEMAPTLKMVLTVVMALALEMAPALEMGTMTKWLVIAISFLVPATLHLSSHLSQPRNKAKLYHRPFRFSSLSSRVSDFGVWG